MVSSWKVHDSFIYLFIFLWLRVQSLPAYFYGSSHVSVLPMKTFSAAIHLSHFEHDQGTTGRVCLGGLLPRTRTHADIQQPALLRPGEQLVSKETSRKVHPQRC